MVGSFVPSSRWLAREMLQEIDFESASCIVELGAGTGPVTAELLQRINPDCRVVIVERDPDLCSRLRERFPEADIAEADALNLNDILASRNIDTVDHIVCGLSLAWFKPADQHRILDTSRRLLGSCGSFRQVTYMPLVQLPLYRRYFQQVEPHFVLRNMPPAGVYICHSPKLDHQPVAHEQPVG